MVLDISVKKLAEAMVNLFSWAKEAQSLDQKVPQFTKIIELMAQQATECAVFIKDYSSRGFLGTQKAHYRVLIILLICCSFPNTIFIVCLLSN